MGITARLHRYQQPWIVTTSLLLVLLVTMEVVSVLGLVSPILLRQPTEIFALLFVQLQTETFQSNILLTSYRVFLTFVLCVAIAAVLSVVFWRNDLLNRTYIPLLGALFGTPLVLLYLVFVVIFGRGTAAIVAISVPIGTIPIIINSTDALASVERTYVDVSRSFNATRGQMIRKVILPAAAPGIFAGIRIGFSYMITVVVAVEFLLVADGLGGMISDAYFRFQTTNMFVGITLIIVLVVIAIFLLRRAEEVIRH